MIRRFEIKKSKNDKLDRYVIKRKSWLIPPIYYMRTMTKNEFFGGLTNYGDSLLSQDNAYFRSLDQAYDALHQHAQIKGVTEVIVKICE